MCQTTRRTDDTNTEAAGITEMTTTATGVNGDAMAMKTRRGDHTDIAPTVIGRSLARAQDHHTNDPTTEIAMTVATDLDAIEIALRLVHDPLADVATKMIVMSAASPILARNDPDPLGQSLDHRTVPGETTGRTTKEMTGEMITAGIRDDVRRPMSVLETDNRNRIAHHLRNQSVTNQRSKQSVRSVWQLCSQMLPNWRSIAARDLQNSMREMRSSGRRTIARDPTRPTSLVAYGRKPRVSILGEDCKVNVAVAMMTEFSVAISLLEERTFEKACVHIA